MGNALRVIRPMVGLLLVIGLVVACVVGPLLPVIGLMVTCMVGLLPVIGPVVACVVGLLLSVIGLLAACVGGLLSVVGPVVGLFKILSMIRLLVSLATFALSHFRRPDRENPTLAVIQAHHHAETAQRQAEQAAEEAQERTQQIQRQADQDREQARVRPGASGRS